MLFYFGWMPVENLAAFAFTNNYYSFLFFLFASFLTVLFINMYNYRYRKEYKSLPKNESKKLRIDSIVYPFLISISYSIIYLITMNLLIGLWSILTILNLSILFIMMDIHLLSKRYWISEAYSKKASKVRELRRTYIKLKENN